MLDGNGAMGLSAADVAAVMGKNGDSGGDGMFGGNNAILIIVLLLFAFMGRGFGGNNGTGGGGTMPYMPYIIGGNTQADVQRGFDQAATQGSLAAIQTQIGAGFSDAALARCAGDANIVSAITTAKDTLGTSLNSLAMQLQNCCCENRMATADLKYTMATESCATRQTISDGLRDLIMQNTNNTNAIIQSQNAGFQGIQDKLCQMELNAKDERIAQLQNQLNMTVMQNSNTEQTNRLMQDNSAQA